MKRFMFLYVLCTILVLQITSCDGLGKKQVEEARAKMEAEKIAEEELNNDVLNILDFKGKNTAIPEFAGTHWGYVFSDVPKKEYDIDFKGDNNGVNIAGDYAEYFFEKNIITFDFSRIISIYEKWTLDHDVRRMYISFQREIAAAQEELKSPSLTPEKKVQLQKLIKENEKALPHYVSADALISSEFEYLKKQRGSASTPTDEELKKQAYENVENNFRPDLTRKRATILREANPIKATLSADKKTLTLKKMLVKQNADGTAEYAENVVFTRE